MVSPLRTHSQHRNLLSSHLRYNSLIRNLSRRVEFQTLRLSPNNIIHRKQPRLVFSNQYRTLRWTPVSPAAVTRSVSKSMRKKNRRKRKQGNWSFVVAILCFIIFFGVVAVIVTMKKPELKGTLQASIAHKNALPPSRIHFATLNLTGEEATNAANAFKEAKESFLSPQMTCSLEASDTELSIVIRPSGEGVWYTVSPSSDANLMNWIRSNRDSILSAKRERMISTGTEMCRDKILKNSGETLAFNPARYRDDFALNSCVDAFGYSIVAIANKKMSPCCYEDPNGLLYFCLPEGTTSFQIRGRDFEGSRWFPGTYQVTVDVASTASPAAEAPAPATDEHGRLGSTAAGSWIFPNCG